ncbi:histone H3.v1-like [Capsicum annuum]|uniref:histone H3.v1-like n=1 Tax=Capsicum annuum TaxID=4072 RepID=UPI0007BFD49E|nr:histone H3.v1-like [Capsicum annuum]
MKMDYMVTFNPYTDEVKNNVLDGLKKDLQRVTVLTSYKDSDDDGDLGGNPVGVRVDDDASPSTSKDVEGTSVDGDLHKPAADEEEEEADKEETEKAASGEEKEEAEEEKEGEKEAIVVGEEKEEAEEEKEGEKEAATAGEEKKEAEEEK